MPVLDEGAEAAEEIAEQRKAEGGKFFRIQQLPIKVGEEPPVLRFVTDYVRRPLASGEGFMPGWLPVDIHGYIPTKPQPEEYDGQKWPPTMWAVCMNAKIFRVRDDQGKPTDEFEPGYGNCYICAKYAGVKEGKFQKDKGRAEAQVLALAVLREAVRDKKTGNPIGFKDKTVDWTDPDGNTVQVPHFVVVNQKYTNFFAPLKNSCFMEPLTVTNRDYVINRDEKTYTPTPIATTPDFMHGTPQWKAQYEDVLAAIGFDLKEYVLAHGTQDHYDRWFVEGATPKDGYARKGADAKAEDSGSAEPEAAAGPSIDSAAMDAYKASLANRGAKQPA